MEVATTTDNDDRQRGNLRTGYTTGACAAAASKAAALALLRQQKVTEAKIALPDGQQVGFLIVRCEVSDGRALGVVVKDGGDDPDATHGAEIHATVSWTAEPGIIALERGEGVGIVTKPGLELPVGAAAINPVPRRMIDAAVREALGGALAERGVRVVISVPEGEIRARKTLNQRLGILGGISILGTSGIVVPFSTAAYTASIEKAMGVAVAVGCREVVLTTGRRGERFAQKLIDLPEEAFIQAGDFVGFALDECVRRKMQHATLCLMIGKLSKIAAGHFQTHVSKSSIEQRFLAQVTAENGGAADVVDEVARCNTARHAAEIFQARGLGNLFGVLCGLAVRQCSRHVERKMAVECILVDSDGSVLGRSGVFA